MQTGRPPGLLSILLLALGLATVVLTSIDEFRQLADGVFGVQAIASALAASLFAVSLLVLFMRRANRNDR